MCHIRSNYAAAVLTYKREDEVPSLAVYICCCYYVVSVLLLILYFVSHFLIVLSISSLVRVSKSEVVGVFLARAASFSTLWVIVSLLMVLNRYLNSVVYPEPFIILIRFLSSPSNRFEGECKSSIP